MASYSIQSLDVKSDIHKIACITRAHYTWRVKKRSWEIISSERHFANAHVEVVTDRASALRAAIEDLMPGAFHNTEQYANNRLIRPRAEYIGPDYPQRYVPLEQR